MISHNPLHGSGRAGFPHPALALGDDAHATQRIGMAFSWKGLGSRSLMSDAKTPLAKRRIAKEPFYIEANSHLFAERLSVEICVTAFSHIRHAHEIWKGI
jgi:hypothetical protein